MGVIGGLFKVFIMFFLGLLMFISMARKDWTMFFILFAILLGFLFWLYRRGQQE